MKIDGNTLAAIIPDLEKRGIDNPYKAAAAIGRYYCDPLTMVDMCPEVCTQCTRHLDNMTRDLTNARNWYALLIWLAKNERAVVKDENSAHEALSGAENINIFEAFLADL